MDSFLAYKLNSGKAPLWGNVAPRYGSVFGSPVLGDCYLDPRQYVLDDWLEAYRNR